MKKSIVGLLMVMLLVPAFSFASTATPTTVTSEQAQVDQRQELMLQLISLLRTYITQLQQQLALKDVTGAPVVLGVSTSTASSTEQVETPKKRRGGGGGGGGSRNNSVVIPPVATTTDPGTGTTTDEGTSTTTDDGTDHATSTLGYATVIKLTDSKGNTYEQSEYNDKDSEWPSPRPTLTVGETVTITVDVENQIAEPVQYQFIGTGFPNEWQENNFVTVTIDEDVFNTETIHLRVFVKNSDTLYRAPDYDDLIQVFYTKGQSTSTIDETEPLLLVELLSSDTYTQGVDDQIGIFESTYELTAHEYDYYLVDYYFDLNGPDAEGAVITTAVNTDAEEVADDIYLIPAGETKTFEYQHAVQVPDSGFYRIEPRWMLYLDETNEISDPIETGNLIALGTEFRTDYLFINENPSIPNSDENALDGFAVLRYAQLDQADETNLETGSGESVLAVLTLGFEGGDVKITDLDAVFTTVPNVDLFEAFSSFSLWIDGDLIEVVSVTDLNFDEQEDTIQFSGLDIVVMDDLNVQHDEIEIIIAGNINSDVAPSVIGDYELAVTGVAFVNGLEEEVYETSLGDIGIDGDVSFSIIDFIDTKLRFSESSDNPDSTYLTVEKDERSDSMTILVGDIEAYEGDAHIDYAVIRINTPGAQTTGIIDDVDLILDGSSYSSEPVTTFSDNNSEAGPDGEFVWYVFQVDQSILDGEEISAEVQVQFEAQENNYSNFQPVQAEIDNDTRNLWVVGGTYALTGEDNFIGNITGDTHYLLAEGLFIDESSIEFETNTLGENDTVGEFVFEFELTAFENDFYIPTSPSSAITYQIEGTESNPAVSVAITSTADEESQTYSIREGETENVQITFTIDPNSAGTYRVVLQDLFYSISNTGAPVVGSIADQQLVIRSPYQSINN